ncbi:suppressor of fused homolog [Battus philenor]|uniref:suppressor of fused homolog n=1 Tax=Battus philenor TaxID=42288 RepID=UPI0035CF07B3
MSGANSAAPSSGVIRNSALSFVASAQTPSNNQTGPPPQDMDSADKIINTGRLVPAGLKALCEAYTRLYPDQPNPLQVTTRLKYWLGGQDPLDYISMYWNPGKPDDHIPPHWHYVSFGLSDLHGDGRVHPELVPGSPRESGYGLELTFRLAAEDGAAPLWPAALLQALARYVFTTGNKFCAGDHISWHAPLDGDSESRLRHLLVAEDPQLPQIQTPHGSVKFIQMVGCTGRELKAAQRGSGFDVLKLIGEDPRCGGSWLVTRARRRASARRVRSNGGGSSAPAPLAGVSARIKWLPYVTDAQEPPASPSELSPTVERQIKETLQRGLSCMSSGERSAPEGHNMSTDSFEMSSMERALPQVPELMQGSWRCDDSVEYLDGVHLVLNAEGASLLPLAIDGRVAHGRHFTWRCGPRAVTFVGGGVTAALPSLTRPYAQRGPWLQMLIPGPLVKEMSSQVAPLARLADSDSESDCEGDSALQQPPSLPVNLHWPRYRLKITVLPDHEFI